MTDPSLRERNRELEEENRSLHAALEGLQLLRWSGIRVIRSRALMLGMLSTGKCFSVEIFLDALQSRYPREDDRGSKTIDVHIFHLRRLLGALDPPICIRNIWGTGYIMDPDDCALLHARETTTEG